MVVTVVAGTIQKMPTHKLGISLPGVPGKWAELAIELDLMLKEITAVIFGLPITGTVDRLTGQPPGRLFAKNISPLSNLG